MVDEADELYGLPGDEFTSARDALAKRLRGEKRFASVEDLIAQMRRDVEDARRVCEETVVAARAGQAPE